MTTDHETDLGPDVHHIAYGGKRIVLVGTAHVSQGSVDLVEAVIRHYRPDRVAIELCQSRYDALRDPEKWKRTDLFQIIKSGKSYVLMAQLMLASFQKKLGNQLGIRPGAEMLKAAEIAGDLGIPIVLADREIRTTLKRTWAGLGFWTMTKLAASLCTGFFSNEKVSEEEIERLKTKDALESLMAEFSQALPQIQRTLIDERDRYLAHKVGAALDESEAQSIVAVVGAGHVPGMKLYIDEPQNLVELETLPPKGKWGKIIGYSIPVLIIGLIIFGFFKAGSDTGIKMIEAWALINIVCTAVGGILSLAHPLAIVTAALGSPYTAINPFIAAGWVAGLVQAYIRKPTVSDFEDLNEDILSIRGVFKNRITHILLVMCITNIFGALGTVSGLVVLGWLAKAGI